MSAAERPDQIFQLQAAQHMRIVEDIHIVVVIDEAEPGRSRVEQERGGGERQAETQRPKTARLRCRTTSAISFFWILGEGFSGLTGC